jgi:hypothetical protein
MQAVNTNESTRCPPSIWRQEEDLRSYALGQLRLEQAMVIA